MRHLRQAEPLPADLADVAELRAAILGKLAYSVGRDAASASPHDWFVATALAVRDRIVDRWMDERRRDEAAPRKQVYYLSIEFLIGRLLFDALTNLDLVEPARAALSGLGVDLDELRALEPDAALGNGGLGRLAACFMDSMASLGIPAHGYGIRYQYGLFKQEISDGRQQELPEDWLAAGNPWEFERPALASQVCFGGSVEYVAGSSHDARGIWYPAETIQAVPYDTPVVGWRGRHVNTLRLWSARAGDPIALRAFNRGDYADAMAARAQAEAISRVLYPSDATAEGQELRLRQEFFFTSASLQDIVRRHLQRHGSLRSLPDQAAIQLNDTHPAIAVAELMRILVDEQDCSWQEAWRITTSTLNYTNHTLLPEALESWPLSLLNRLLPRHLQIIYLINHHHLRELAERGITAPATVSSLSLIDENGEKRVRMGHLAFVGSHRVNGVSALHTELMRGTVFGELEAIRPGRIVSKTNGVSFRRWLYQANPALTSLLTEVLGEQVLDDSRAARRARALRRRRQLRPPRCRDPPRQQGGARPRRARAHRRDDRTVGAARRAHQAHPRVQAPAAQSARDHRLVPVDPRPAAARLDAPRQALRRQGGDRLRPRQADHQARPRRGPRGQRRPDRRRPAESGVSCRTTASAWRSGSSRRPTSPSRSRPPGWRRPEPET